MTATLLTGPSTAATLTIVSLPAAIAAVSGDGQTASANAALASPVVVRVTAGDGGPASNVPVTFAADAGGAVSVTQALTGADGTASTQWTLGSAVGTQTLTVTASGLSGSPVTFHATSRSRDPVKLALAAGPPQTLAAGAAFTLSAQALTADGDVASAFGGAVTAALGPGAPAGAALGGTTSVNAVNGVATFGNLQLTVPGTYTLSLSAGALAAAVTPPITVTAGPVVALAFQNYPLAGATAGVPLGAFGVSVTDQFGNVVTDFAGPITVTANGPGAATPLTVTGNAVAGIATFGALTLMTAGNYTLTATGASLGKTGPAFIVAPAPARRLVLAGGGGQSGTGGAALAAPVVVTATDALGNGVAGVAVSFTPAAGSGTAAPVSATTGADGRAQTAWTLGTAAGAMTMNVSGAGLEPNPLVVHATATAGGAAGPATTLVFTTQPSPSPAAGPITPAVVVAARDSAGLAATTFTGTVTVALGTNPGGATLGGTKSVVAVAGVATFTGLSVNIAGNGYTLIASSSGLPAVTSNAFNIATAAIASTTVSPQTDSLTAIGATDNITAQARDAGGNPAAGTFSWMSRNPSVAGVNSSGTVKAMANGSTWIVATESGGTKDSALIVVSQKLATIHVTPDTRSIYLGASYQFAANAVDGLGVPLASQPAFAWSTASGAIASVSGSGIATGTGLGATQVRATSGSVTGIAQLTVLTPITRIVVSRDSAGFPKTAADTFTLGAIGRTRSYVATARDTLDNPIPGIVVSWTSSNGAVASLDSINSATVRATAAANGVTSITASAQGISGSAVLTVQQVLTSIDLSPAAATIAPSGSVVLVARGRDANGVFIPGGSFTYSSAQPAIATVNATSGVVTGAANGTASVTASNGAITSNVAVITVGGSVPATISFGRDTLAVGRSGTSSVPVYLSKPSASPVTVNLAVRDTFAFFSQASITIPAGQTSGNATLNGHNAGTTQIYATDGGGSGYAGDTATLAVQAAVKFTSTSYSLNVSGQTATQILLSDPAPAGGTYVTFNYGTAGKVNVSPDPAFIPMGQLAANVVILATGVNTSGTAVTPTATGVTGTASTVRTYAATLSGTTSLRLGTGQYEPNVYLGTPVAVTAPLSVTLTSSDTTIVRVPAGTVISQGSASAYFVATAVAPGAATITASAPGWTPLATNVSVTSPKVGVCCAASLNTTSPQYSVTVYAQDSTSASHPRTNSLVVTLTSTDTTVIKLLTPTVTIPAGQYYTSSGAVIPGGAGGTARVIATASGHKPDSTALYNVAGPKLSLSWTTANVGEGQYDQNLAVYTPNSVTGSPLVVNLLVSDTAIIGMPASVTIPVGSSTAYFNVVGRARGTVNIYATAAGYSPDTARYVVTAPQLMLYPGTTLRQFGTPATATIYTADSAKSAHYITAPLIVTYASTNTSVITVTGADTIAAGMYYSNHARVTPIGTGTARIIATASGYAPDSATYTVETPKLSFSWTTARIGRRQYDQNYYISTPDNRTSALTVTITQARPTVDSLSQAPITINAGSSYSYFNVAGLNTGADTLIATAPGYLPDTAFVIVTTPRFTVSGLPSNVTTTNLPSSIAVYTTDSVGTSHYSLDTVLVKATSGNDAVIQPIASGFRIPRGAYYGQSQVAYVGPGSAAMTYSDSLGTGYQPATTNIVTVTGPSLGIGNSASVLGMRQNGGPTSAYISVPNSITGSPLVVTLASSDPTVVQVPASVTIPVGSNTAYFQVTALDIVGTIQITATAPGYGGATSSVQVTQPRFNISSSSSVNTTSPPATIYVYATDANGNSHYVNENVVVTLGSSSATVGAPDSATVTIPAGAYFVATARFVPGAAGTTQISATDARVAAYKYGAGTFSVAVNTPTLSLSLNAATLAVGQYVTQTIYAPNQQQAALTVSMAHSGAASSTPSSATIAALTSSTTARITAVAAGNDTITYSAPGHNPVVGAVTVAPGRLDPIGGWPATLNAGDSVRVTIYARDANSATHYVAAATTVTLAPSGQIQFVSGAVGSPPVTSVTIPADQQYVQVWVKALAAGSGSASVSSPNYTTYVTPSVNVP